MNAFAIPFKRIAIGDVGTETLSNYRKIVIAGDQPTSFYTTYALNKTLFDAYVNQGGEIEWHLAGFGWNRGDSTQVVLPGGVAVKGLASYLSENYVALPSHPFAAGISSPFSGTYASHGSFQNFEAISGLQTVTTQGPNEGYWPTLIVYSYGKGCVVASTQPLEYGFQFNQPTGTILSNMTPYFCAKSSESAKATGTGYVVTIDGVNIRSILNPEVAPDYSQYLYDAIGCDPNTTNDYWCELIQSRVGQITPYSWSRNIYDTDQYVYEISAILEGFTKLSQKNHGPLVVIAHSWGTVLAYIAISRNPKIVVDKFVTLGSPLNAQNGTVSDYTKNTLAGWSIDNVAALNNVKTWANYWGRCDVISGPIDVLKKNNIAIETNRRDEWGGCHDAYYQDHSVWQDVLAYVYLTK
jgi:hypothetical protein